MTPKRPAALSPFRLGSPFLGLKRRDMPAAEFSALLDAAQLSEDDFEEFSIDLGVTPGIVRDWASGTTAIPRDKAWFIEQSMDAHRRAAALRESGLPACKWIEARDAELMLLGFIDSQRALAFFERMTAHASTCTTCLARTQFLAERFGPIEDPPEKWWNKHRSLGKPSAPNTLAWMPQRFRYAARGVWFGLRLTAFFAAAIGITAIFSSTVREIISPILWNELVLGDITVLVATGLSGIVASWTHAKLRDRTELAPGIAGVAAIYTFAGVIVLAAAAFGQAHPLADFELIPVAGALAQGALIGVVLGFQAKWDDDLIETAPAPSPLSVPPPTRAESESPPKQ